MILARRFRVIALCTALVGAVACVDEKPGASGPGAADHTQPAGAVCKYSDDCATGSYCDEGYCSGGSCTAADGPGCADGYRCVVIVSRGDPISSAVFGSGGNGSSGYECRPACGHCPANMHCPKTKIKFETDGVCVAGFEITITDEGEKILGKPHTLTATAAGHTLGHCSWTDNFKDYVDGTTVTLVLDKQLEPIVVTCEDENRKPVGGELEIALDCVPEGAACDATSSRNGVSQYCCQSGLACTESGSGTPQQGSGVCLPHP